MRFVRREDLHWILGLTPSTPTLTLVENKRCPEGGGVGHKRGLARGGRQGEDLHWVAYAVLGDPSEVFASVAKSCPSILQQCVEGLRHLVLWEGVARTRPWEEIDINVKERSGVGAKQL